MIHPLLMEPGGFWNALGDFPDNVFGKPANALFGPWNGKMAGCRMHQIQLLLGVIFRGEAQNSPWLSVEPTKLMKHLSKWLEHHWRTTRHEFNLTLAKATNWAYAMSVMMVENTFFLCHHCISSTSVHEVILSIQGIITFLIASFLGNKRPGQSS